MRELCQDQAHWEIVKTKDLKSCKERPIYNHVYGARSVSDGSMGSSAPFVGESSVTRSIICGSPDAYILRVSSNQHKALISPSGKFENKEKMEVTSTSIVSFQSLGLKKQDIPDVKSPKPNGSLMFQHPKEDNFASRVSEKSLLRGQNNSSHHGWYKAQILQPDLISRPSTLFPTTNSPEENIRQLVHTFHKIIEISSQSPESSYGDEDVAGFAVIFTHALIRLGLDDIRSLWRDIEISLSEHLQDSAYNAFLDLVSMCGTSPAIKYIIEDVKSGKLSGLNGAMIASNAVRTAKTPTRQLIQELIDLLKQITEHDEHNMMSTVALATTQLIHQACIHQTSSVSDFPVKTYGKFCDEKISEITQDLIPFLSDKLFSVSKDEIYQLLTYINALGNLGHDGASIHLLKVIEDGSFDVHTRSVAVYQLIKSASANPPLYRPIILQIIDNEAEYDEVRMAAITVLSHTMPTSIHLNKLAIRTWWEPSKQVRVYITSTLRLLSNPEVVQHSEIYGDLSRSAQEAIKIARPTESGIHNS